MMRSSTADMVFEGSQRVTDQEGSVDVLSSHHLQNCQHWKYAFASQHKDHRYYEIVADTLHPEFRYLYFALRDAQRQIQAIQPFFILDQDILAGARPYIGRFLDLVRRQWPRFLLMRTMMVGCVAGEAHLDDGSCATRVAHAQLLAGAIAKHARTLGVGLIVLKEFPDNYRNVLSCFLRSGFTRYQACR
jgi:hypothetical protein